MNRMVEEKLTQLEEEADERGDLGYCYWEDEPDYCYDTKEVIDALSINDAIDSILEVIEEFEPIDQNKILKASTLRLVHLRNKMIEQLKESNDTI